MAPTLVRDNPVERIPRLTETNSSVEWNMNSPMKPAVVIKVPKMIGLNEPNLETMKPEVGPKINSTDCKWKLYPSSAYGIFSKSNWFRISD